MQVKDRIYYLGENKHPDIESMVAFLLDEGLLFCHTQDSKLTLFLNINDYFIPAADSEDLTEEDIPILFEAYRSKQYDGVAEFVAKKRNIPNVHWRNDPRFQWIAHKYFVKIVNFSREIGLNHSADIGKA